MHQGLVIDLTPDLAISATRLGHDQRLPLTDSLIWATTQAFDAILWAQDAHLKVLENVHYFSKIRP